MRVVGSDDLVSELAEVLLNCKANAFFVIDDEYARVGHAPSKLKKAHLHTEADL